MHCNCKSVTECSVVETGNNARHTASIDFANSALNSGSELMLTERKTITPTLAGVN